MSVLNHKLKLLTINNIVHHKFLKCEISGGLVRIAAEVINWDTEHTNDGIRELLLKKKCAVEIRIGLEKIWVLTCKSGQCFGLNTYAITQEALE